VTIVNGDDVVGPPVTLELNDVPERQVLDILLRSAAGYMLAARQPGAVGPSRFDRILILPSSTPPRPAPAVPAFQPGRPAIGQPRPPVQPPEAEPAEPVDVVPDDPDASQPGRPNLGPREVPVIPRPFDGVPQGEAPAPAPTGPAGTPPTQANPFGVPFGTTARPGIVTPPPQPSNPNARPDPGP
jgi:hypothetical protein